MCRAHDISTGGFEFDWNVLKLSLWSSLAAVPSNVPVAHKPCVSLSENKVASVLGVLDETGKVFQKSLQTGNWILGKKPHNFNSV